ncbi:MAG: nucleotide exchange factor GrpE [Actinobacteria bacterium]|nr:nucleotide exchange factor GrpE [Actinomycetota bacterium]
MTRRGPGSDPAAQGPKAHGADSGEQPEEQVEAAAGEAAADASSNGAEATEAGDRPQESGEQAEEAAPQPQPEPDPLAQLQAERDEYLQLAQRAQADFENYRKRATKDLAAAGERAKIGLVRDLLPVLDNLERALVSADGDTALAEGVRLVLADLRGVLSREGVDALEPAGEPFDPTVHEALSTRAEDGADAGVVLDVVEKGYRLGDTVIRPARVVVSA